MREFRRKKAMSQADLAKAIGTTQATVSDIERGKAESSQYVMTICKVLGIQPPIFSNDDLDRRWIRAGATLKSKSFATFEQLLRTAEQLAITLPG